MIGIYLDNNVWDYLYKESIDLSKYFPKEKYNLLISKHGRFEIDQIPDSESTIGLKDFVRDHLSSYISERHTFGFHDPNFPDSEQRVSGFGVGVFTSTEENEERKRLKILYSSQEKRKPEMILCKEEADIELGALSMNSFVLTFDKKAGPLKNSYENGG